ncbi:callose synthase [Vigna unguiculata]|uniref:Callose synthase n=1 Tax=Vigna unguiculata TaxID=3917 RepID=A0A4D6MVX4_VIGUN|nr:callose synthase [Vigna unguiculata]
MDSDSALTEDLIAYNIIPLDTSSSTNAIVSLPEWLARVAQGLLHSFIEEH